MSDKKREVAGGQVSEVDRLGGEPEPISPEDATAGYPTSESGEPDEGAAGPDAGASQPGSADRTHHGEPHAEE